MQHSSLIFDCMLLKEGIETLSAKEIDDMPVETLAMWIGFLQEIEAKKWDVKGIKMPTNLRGLRGR